MDYLPEEEGFGNIVTWVHVIETVDGAAFLHGREVVLTTGVLEQGENFKHAFSTCDIEQKRTDIS